MQTFLPIMVPDAGYASCIQSAKVLDYRRLGKQRVEAWQIYRTLIGQSQGWKNHPAVRMWRGYDSALAIYGRVMCHEWIARGYKDTCLDRFPLTLDYVWPQWMFDSAFSAAHRSNLLRKNAVWYGQFGWSELDTLPYVWPV